LVDRPGEQTGRPGIGAAQDPGDRLLAEMRGAQRDGGGESRLGIRGCPGFVEKKNFGIARRAAGKRSQFLGEARDFRRRSFGEEGVDFPGRQFRDVTEKQAIFFCFREAGEGGVLMPLLCAEFAQPPPDWRRRHAVSLQ
jgi:hypothetical protein